MRWLISGGCGFIGLNLVRLLTDTAGESVRVLDDLSTGKISDLAGVGRVSLRATPESLKWIGPERQTVELIRGDVRDRDIMRAAVEGADIFVHLAANTGVAQSVADPSRDCDVNVIGTLVALQASRTAGVRRFVFASSGAPIGDCVPPLHEELPARPVSPYGASKLAGEAYCSAFWRSYGLETVALRFGNVYGPRSGHKSSVVARFIGQALRNETWSIYGDGRQTRDFIHVEDLVRAVWLAATTRGIGGELFQIATNSETTVGELAQKLSDIAVALGVTPPSMEYVAARTGDVVRNYSDVSKARSRLGWTPQIALDDGLHDTFRWFVEARARRWAM